MIKINGKKLEVDTYPNGETKIDLSWMLEERNIEIISIQWKYESDSEFILLKFVSDYIGEKMGFTKLILHILYMPYSRMDRSENNSVFTLKSACRMINEMVFDVVYINEPHSSKTESLLVNCVPLNVTNQLLEEVILNRKDDKFVVFYPDKGAKERYNMGKYPSLTGSKKRDFDTGRITSYDIDDHDEDIEGLDVYIIDDLCSFGGTFVAAANKLVELGANDIYLVVAHAEASIMKGELFDYIKKVYTTNSIISQNYLFTLIDNDPSSKKVFPIDIVEII